MFLMQSDCFFDGYGGTDRTQQGSLPVNRFTGIAIPGIIMRSPMPPHGEACGTTALIVGAVVSIDKQRVCRHDVVRGDVSIRQGASGIKLYRYCFMSCSQLHEYST